jgi:translation initiation factor IF-2
MTKKRVHEIAKEQGMSSADVLTKLRAAGFDVTAAASTVDEAEALRALGGNGATPPRPAAPAADRWAAKRCTQSAGKPAGRASSATDPPPSAHNSSRARPCLHGYFWLGQVH